MKFGKQHKTKIAKTGIVQVLAWTAALAMVVPSMPAAQQDQQGQGPVIKSEVTLVNLFATVRDKNHRVVTDLKQDDFKVYEDGREEKIAFFSKEMQLPITLGLLLDTSGSEQIHAGIDSGCRRTFYAPRPQEGRRGYGDLVRLRRRPSIGFYG